LDEVVAGLVERARETTGEDVVFEVEPGLGKVSGDRLLVREVWKQLIDNAVKFRGEAPPRVEIGRAAEGGWFVRDNGVGIDPRHLRKVFGLFDKLDPATEGTGLGLAVAKRIVEEMGGRIRIESLGLGSGVTVFFTLREDRHPPGRR
jgi:signal transduction histidine kinase